MVIHAWPSAAHVAARRLVQAQTQPALAQAYDSEYACALKVVFDRVSLWRPLQSVDAARKTYDSRRPGGSTRRTGLSRPPRLFNEPRLPYLPHTPPDDPLAAPRLPAAVRDRRRDPRSQVGEAAAEVRT